MLTAHRITSADDALFQQTMQLYRLSFPEVERRDLQDNERLLQDRDFYLLALQSDGEYVGMAGVWDADGMLYVEHLCTLPSVRGKGLGAAALQLFKDSGKTVVLEIEPPEDELTSRRREFYRRNGFVWDAHLHLHPPYRKGDPRHRLNVMSYPCAPDAQLIARLEEFIERKVGGGE